jgi:hypothetical protein
MNGSIIQSASTVKGPPGLGTVTFPAEMPSSTNLELYNPAPDGALGHVVHSQFSRLAADGLFFFLMPFIQRFSPERIG